MKRAIARTALVFAVAFASSLACTTSAKNTKADRRVGPDEPWRATKPASKAAAEFKLPQFQKAELKNGLTVFVVEDHGLPMVTAGVVVRGGSASESAKEAGLAALTYDLLDEGAGSFNNLQLANEFAKLGSRVNAFARREYGVVSVELLKKHADAGLDLLSTVVRKPTFAAADFDRVRAQRVAFVKQKEGQPRNIASSVFDELAYGGDHPYGHDEDGSTATLDKISRERVKKFWSDVAEPKNAALFLAGDITLDEAKAMAEKHFGKWTGTGHSEKTPADPKARSALKLAIVDVPGAPQSVVRIGRAVMAEQDPEEPALVVFDEIMGGQFSSRLNLKLREEKQWTYGAKSRAEFRLGKGPWIVSADVQTPNTADAVSEVLAQFDLVKQKGVTDDEVARAKDGYIKSLPSILGLPQQQLTAAAALFTYNLPADYFDKRVEAVKAVKADDVKKVAERALVKEDMVVVVVGDKAAIEPKLKTLGELASYNRDGTEVAQK